MKVVYSPAYEIDLGGHVWPIAKYRLIAERLLASGLVGDAAFVVPVPCTWDGLALVHRSEYLDKVRTCALTPAEIQTLELPLSPALGDRFPPIARGTPP